MPYAKWEDQLAASRRYKTRQRALQGLPPCEPRKPAKSAEERAAVKAAYRQRNKEAILDYAKAYYARTGAKRAEYIKSKSRKETVLRSNRKRRSTAVGALHNRIGCQVYKALRSAKAGRAWPELLGYSLDELIPHIERQFTRGMSWPRLAAGEIHIDHIIPLASFGVNDASESVIRQAWALTNLRPLWAVDNMKKGARIETLL